jgi:peptide/nickel transport system substrate-binding protein
MAKQSKSAMGGRGSSILARTLLVGALTAASMVPAFADTPQKGGTLVVGRVADVDTFDPYNTQDDPSIFTELTVFERLVRLADDGRGIAPELATSWKISSDGLTADFTLRQGVKFSDGTPLSADDVVFSLNRAVDQKGSWGFLFSPVKSVSKVDDKTVRIEMSEPFAPLLTALSTFAASIYSKSNFEKWGDQAGNHPLGTGAFALKSWSRGQEVVLVRNTYYWQEGKPYLDSVEFRDVGDDNARTVQLASGDLNLIANVPATQVTQITGAGGVVARVPGTMIGFIELNHKIPPLGDRNARCALAYALDRESIAKVVYMGFAAPALSLMPSATLFYDPNTDPVKYDLGKAKAALTQSTVPNGFTLNVNVRNGTATDLAVAQIWAAALAKIGITLNIQQIEATTAQQLVNSEQYAIDISTWTNDTPDPDELMGVTQDYQSQDADHSNYHSDEARNLVIAARKEMDPAKRQALYSKLQQLVNTDCSYFYTANEDRIFAAQPAVQGFAPNSQGKYNFEKVWLKQ